MRLTKLFFLTSVFVLMYAVGVSAQANTQWYSETESDFHISEPQELEGLAQLVNSGTDFNGKTVYLDSDIDLDSYENWTPIGNSTEHYFTGEFNGNNHTISNLHIKTADGYYNGLFGIILGGKITNLDLADTDISITNINFVREDGYQLLAGGFAGMLCGELMICENVSGKVEINCDAAEVNDSAAGLSGITTNLDSDLYTAIRFCGNKADVCGNVRCAGITASYYTDSGIEYCYNKGNITGTNGASAAGITIDCWGSLYCNYNAGKISADNVKCGITANIMDSGTVSNCIDYCPNDSTVICAGTFTDIIYNSAGSMTVTKVGSSADYSLNAAAFDNMTSEEILSYINNDESLLSYYILALNCKYPVLWWESTYGGEKRYGDMDGDGNLSARDVAYLLKYLGGLYTLNEEQMLLADYDLSGTVNLLDVINLQNDERYYADSYLYN